MIHFLKNLSIMGGLLYVARYGAGRYSLDAGIERAGVADTSRPLKKVVHQ
jgi:putative oxidoreductase